MFTLINSMLAVNEKGVSVSVIPRQYLQYSYNNNSAVINYDYGENNIILYRHSLIKSDEKISSDHVISVIKDAASTIFNQSIIIE